MSPDAAALHVSDRELDFHGLGGRVSLAAAETPASLDRGLGQLILPDLVLGARDEAAEEG